jgi:hypothetical protein
MPSTIKYFNHGRQLHVQFLRIEDAYYEWPGADRIRRMKYWEILADNLSKAGWSWGYVSAIDSNGRTIWIADAHRDDGKRYVVRAGPFWNS